MRIDVIIATHGHTRWRHLARTRALPSVESQTGYTNPKDPVAVNLYHDTRATLAMARNAAASRSEAELLVFLDADDELAPGYMEALTIAAAPYEWQGETIPLFVPRVQYVRGSVEEEPKFPNRHAPIEVLNWCVIGTAVPRWLFEQVGGFREWPCYEDYELWLRCIRAGAVLVDVPDAIYRAHLSRGSRNVPAVSVKSQVYREIREEHLAAVREGTEAAERAETQEGTILPERAGSRESTVERERWR